MKIKFLRFLNFVIFTILSCFGISSTKQVMAMYGVPAGEFQLSGRVENLKSKPVRKIEVEVQDNQQRILGVTSTEKDGSFQLDYKGWPHQEIYLISRDKDGWRNGSYRSDTTIVKLDYPQQGWNKGKASATQNIILKYKSERKNRRNGSN